MTYYSNFLKSSPFLEIPHQTFAYVLLFLLLGCVQIGISQTCCSGGVPLSNNLGLPISEKGTTQFAVNYDLNVLETLKTGRQILDDKARSRKTRSFLLEIGYSFSNKFSVDAFFSYVRQERKINQFGNRNFSATNGVGDAVFLFKYKVWENAEQSTVLQLGLGPKIPIGATKKASEIGLRYNADLQPGSGAWDAILFAQFIHALAKRPSMALIGTGTYSLKGKNNSYFDVQTYQFGKELLLSFGLSDQLLWGKMILDPAVIFQYRNQTADRIDGGILPSTGGNWIFINPSITYWMQPNWSFNIGASLPLYANITGTQVTPTYRITSGFFYRILGKSKESMKVIF